VREWVRAKLLSRGEGTRLEQGLAAIRRELDAGRFRFLDSDEDIHMAIERRLVERLGPLGGKLHTGRSRNDQVALDLRLWIRAECDAADAALARLQRALVALARRHREAIVPGYTHLQRAQPILLAHHLLAYREMFARDRARFRDCRARGDELPLGAGALAGAGFPLDRKFLARELGFTRVSQNSIDAVADRDTAVEFLAAAAITAVHLSRLAEDLVLWATDEFGFLELPDAFATGSSMMPPEKNPDVAELGRGKDGRRDGRARGAPHHAEGLTARLQSRPAGGQAGAVRCGRDAPPVPGGLHGDAAGARLPHRADGRRGRRPPPGHRPRRSARRARHAVPAGPRPRRGPRPALPGDRPRAARPRCGDATPLLAPPDAGARPQSHPGALGRSSPRPGRHGPA